MAPRAGASGECDHRRRELSVSNRRIVYGAGAAAAGMSGLLLRSELCGGRGSPQRALSLPSQAVTRHNGDAMGISPPARLRQGGRRIDRSWPPGTLRQAAIASTNVELN